MSSMQPKGNENAKLHGQITMGLFTGVMSGGEGVAQRSRVLMSRVRSLAAADRMDETPSE
jgi:hypothetical protein